MKGKGFNDTPHFCSLPQGEIRDGRKNFKRPLTLALSRLWRGNKEDEKILTYPHPTLSSGERVNKGRKDLMELFILTLL
jgi:hypothetical protein